MQLHFFSYSIWCQINVLSICGAKFLFESKPVRQHGIVVHVFLDSIFACYPVSVCFWISM